MNTSPWYEILEVSEDASEKEVRNARDKMARKYLKEGNIARFTEVNSAYSFFAKWVPKQRLQAKEHKNLKEQQEKWSRRERRESILQTLKQIVYFTFTALLVPLSIGLWAIHPLLGILGIVFFLWLVRNKWTTEYYFGL